jgi:hypothetical protein
MLSFIHEYILVLLFELIENFPKGVITGSNNKNKVTEMFTQCSDLRVIHSFSEDLQVTCNVLGSMVSTEGNKS